MEPIMFATLATTGRRPRTSTERELAAVIANEQLLSSRERNPRGVARTSYVL